jgi:ABC-2 type transport system ATP-binding protein
MYLRGAPERILPTLIATAGERKVAIIDLSMAKPTLETVFINLTGRELRG